jgi:hypothetical protein
MTDKYVKAQIDTLMALILTMDHVNRDSITREEVYALMNRYIIINNYK